MTAAVSASPGGPGPAAPEGSRWRRTRGWVVVAAAIVLALAAAVWTTRDAEDHPDPLDPRNAGPEGAQAVAKVLDDQGVDVTIARSAEELAAASVDGDTTVVVTSTHLLSAGTLRQLRTEAAPGRLVMVEPDWTLLQEIDAAQGSSSIEDEKVAAGCESVDGIGFSGLAIEVDVATTYAGTGCFPGGTGRVLVADPAEDVVLFGAGQSLSNDQVLRADNAAVALRLLGEDPRLVWYVPDPDDATGDDAISVGTLLPGWLGPALWTLAIACVGLVLWRSRRLGPLSTEPLPVVVRAVETARSRGRMYRKSGDRAHAAAALRRATARALATRLRLDRRAGTVAVAEATARHLGARVEEIDHLLNGPPPATDPELVRLAQELTRLRREVRRR